MDYLPIFPIFVLLAAAAVLILIRIFRPASANIWLIAAAAALLTWLLVLLAHNSLPQTLSLFSWQPAWLFPQSPALLVDQYSWGFAFSIAALGLSAILTDVARSGSTNWFGWFAILALSGLGLAAVQAGNPLTLLMLWTAIDFIETAIYLYVSTSTTSGIRYMISISARAAGTFLFIWTVLFSGSEGMTFEGLSLSSQAGLLLLLAAILRTGIFPLSGTFHAERTASRSLVAVSRFVVAASGMILITRSASIEFLSSQIPILAAITGLVALYCSLSWMISRNETDGLPYWIIGWVAFAIAAAIRSQPDASAAWGVSAILAGGLSTLITMRHRYMIVLLLIGLMGITSLPFTPAWNGVLLYTPAFELPLALFILAQSMYMVGYLRYALRMDPGQSNMERWIWIIYLWGLAILPVSQNIAGWLGWVVPLRWSTVLPGLLAVILTAIWLAVASRFKEPPPGYLVIRQVILGINHRITLEGLSKLIARVFNAFGRSISVVSAVLEGDGGVLWALFFLVLFIAILTQIRLGV